MALYNSPLTWCILDTLLHPPPSPSFFFQFVMQHGWRSSHIRFSFNGGLFQKTVKTKENQQKICVIHSKASLREMEGEEMGQPQFCSDLWFHKFLNIQFRSLVKITPNLVLFRNHVHFHLYYTQHEIRNYVCSLGHRSFIGFLFFSLGHLSSKPL